MREGGFPGPDEPVDEGGRAKAQARAVRPAPEVVVTAPALAARQTVEALGLTATMEPALADIDHAAWQGRTLTDLQASEPEALMDWIRNPAMGVPGGESFASVLERVAAWMARQAPSDRRILAVASPTILRAALAHVLDIPPPAAFRIDIAPLAMLTLSFNRQWRFQGLGGESGPT